MNHMREYMQYIEMGSMLCQLLQVGALLVVNGRAFELLDADEFTLRFMEERPQMFAAADAQQVRAGIATG